MKNISPEISRESPAASFGQAASPASPVGEASSPASKPGEASSSAFHPGEASSAASQSGLASSAASQEILTECQSLARAFAAAFPRTLPISISFFILGVAYSMLMQSKGYGFPWPVLMSVIAFCGSMQFVAVSLLTIAFDPVQALLISLLVNARHCFYALSMLEPFRRCGKWKPFLCFTLCDETFSLLCTYPAPPGCRKAHYYFAVSFLNYAYWGVSTLLGCLAGSLLDFNAKGMDFALTALFLVMFLEQCKTKEARLPAFAGLILTGICLAAFGSGSFILPAMAALMAFIFLLRKSLPDKTSEKKEG